MDCEKVCLWEKNLVYWFKVASELKRELEMVTIL